MMFQLTNPLELDTILINNLAGSIEIFVIMVFIFLAGLAARFRMNNYVFLTLTALFAVFFTAVVGNVIYFVIIISAGLVVFWGIKAITK